ncbi:phosphotransferase family protein [Promicromonospora panici]|uniref:phosphotransferase family protein n=1 Tax=Promicromonospora panici TaxID=2219658 RepID=UPI0013ED7AC9|nr:aminoglycoside phosphotransferase family protein [Promicromonospora panici]
MRLTGGASPADARSGAGVRRVWLPDGGSAYLKVTGAELGGDALAAAGRELRFYRRVGPDAPVCVPPLLGAFEADAGVALLLGDAGEQRDVAVWSPELWRGLGGTLARLHTMPVPAGDWDRPDALLSALAAPDLDAVAGFWSGRLPRLDELLAGRGALRDRLGSAPPVFVHGDCHTGNVVHGNDVVLCDWQESGTGRATSDLALLSVRATPSGTRVPAVLFEEYLRECACAGVHLDAIELERSLMLEELAVLVFLWPPFAAYNDPAGIDRVRRRARYLADRLGV